MTITLPESGKETKEMAPVYLEQTGNENLDSVSQRIESLITIYIEPSDLPTEVKTKLAETLKQLETPTTREATLSLDQIRQNVSYSDRKLGLKIQKLLNVAGADTFLLCRRDHLAPGGDDIELVFSLKS